MILTEQEMKQLSSLQLGDKIVTKVITCDSSDKKTWLNAIRKLLGSIATESNTRFKFEVSSCFYASSHNNSISVANAEPDAYFGCRTSIKFHCKGTKVLKKISKAFEYPMALRINCTRNDGGGKKLHESFYLLLK